MPGEQVPAVAPNELGDDCEECSLIWGPFQSRREYESYAEIPIGGCYTETRVVLHGRLFDREERDLEQAFILKSIAQQCICAFAFQFKFATDIRAMILHGPVVDGKLRTDFFAGFATRDELHDPVLGRSKLVRQPQICFRSRPFTFLQ